MSHLEGIFWKFIYFYFYLYFIKRHLHLNVGTFVTFHKPVCWLRSSTSGNWQMSWEVSSLYVCAKAKTNDPWKMFVIYGTIENVPDHQPAACFPRNFEKWSGSPNGALSHRWSAWPTLWLGKIHDATNHRHTRCFFGQQKLFLLRTKDTNGWPKFSDVSATPNFVKWSLVVPRKPNPAFPIRRNGPPNQTKACRRRGPLRRGKWSWGLGLP